MHESRRSRATRSLHRARGRWVHEMQKLIDLASCVGYKFRFDLLYYINTLAQHILFPSKQGLDMTWINTKTENRLAVISDASYGNQPCHKPQIGNIFLLNGKVIGGKSTEAEIHAVSEAVPLLDNLSYLVQGITHWQQIHNQHSYIRKWRGI